SITVRTVLRATGRAAATACQTSETVISSRCQTIRRISSWASDSRGRGFGGGGLAVIGQRKKGGHRWTQFDTDKKGYAAGPVSECGYQKDGRRREGPRMAWQTHGCFMESRSPVFVRGIAMPSVRIPVGVLIGFRFWIPIRSPQRPHALP